MAERSAIAWTRSTFNPWIGCTKVGPGCDHCYAEALDKRMRYGKAVHWGAGVPRFRTGEKNWQGPLQWQVRAMRERSAGEMWGGRVGFWPVFCASLADVFDNEVPHEWRTDLWRLIEATPNLSWLLVTKRIGNVERMVPTSWLHSFPEGRRRFPDNIRLLVTVCNQEEADRDVPKLLALPCKNGISYEPALAPIDFEAIQRPDGLKLNVLFGNNGVDWIIVGGESRQGAGEARPFDVAWARSTIAQCKAAGVPVFVKQIGSRTLGWCLGNRPTGECPELENLECQAFEASEQSDNCPEGHCACREDRAGADPAEWPEDLRVQEFPA